MMLHMLALLQAAAQPEAVRVALNNNALLGAGIGIGLAIVGAGRVGLFRGEVAARHPAVQWIGIAEKNHNRGPYVAEKIGADFVTQDHHELLRRPEVTCAIIATDEHLHVDPVMAAIEPWSDRLVMVLLDCDGCDQALVSKDVEYNVELPDGWTLSFHLNCASMWQVLRMALSE